MRSYQIAPLALLAGRAAASGSQLFHDTFLLNELPDMVSLSDAKLKDIVLPDSLSDFTEWIGGIAEPQAFGLQPRQQRCADAGYYPCSSGLGCCPGGSTCISTGCCRGNGKECGSGRCYDPSSQVCCSSGTACLKSQTCVSGGCCSKGETKCGTSGCYNPNTSVAGAVRQARSGAETASAITHEQRLVVLGQELCGPAQSPVTAVQPATAPTPRLKGVARMAPA
ncbi:hypothetical protein F52700_328 [Fusarium sp. NRRL 52700]|nr:hypothetical protein F52700_328 [Fusarium sp. NRRL 52700]